MSCVGIDKGLTAIETTKFITEARVCRFAAHGVDPELGRTSVEVDSHSLSRGADLQFNRVKEARFLGIDTDFVLTSKHSVLGWSTSSDVKRESNQTRLLYHSIIHGELEQGLRRQRQSRK